MHFEGDIWSENGISLFAIFVHFIDSKLEYHARNGQGMDKDGEYVSNSCVNV